MNEGRTDLNAVGDEKMEARIVAWVLGQASTFEAEELEKFCAENPEWNVYHRRMLALHGLLQEAAAVEASAEWKLEAGRRAKLDQVLGMQQVEASAVGEKRQGNRTQMWQQIAKSAAAILLITLIVGLAKFSLSKKSAERTSLAVEDAEGEGYRLRLPGRASAGPGRASAGGEGGRVARLLDSPEARLRDSEESRLNGRILSKTEVPSAKKSLELDEADFLAESSPLPQPVTSPPPPQVLANLKRGLRLNLPCVNLTIKKIRRKWLNTIFTGPAMLSNRQMVRLELPTSAYPPSNRDRSRLLMLPPVPQLNQNPKSQ